MSLTASPDIAAAPAAERAAPGPERASALPKPAALGRLDSAQKAAIVVAALGPEAAGPLLETLDEGSLRNFTAAMARIRRVDHEVVRHVIAEFLDAIRQQDSVVRGGLGTAREVLEPVINEGMLARLLDDVDSPSAANVWKKLGKVSEEALAEFLAREHPQTAAVILSKLSSEHAGKVLNRLEPERARDVVQGITRTQTLDSAVIEAIGVSVSRDFLATNQHAMPRRNPAERVGAIMNFVSAGTRDAVLDYFDEHQPDFAEEIRRKMFTFEDIPKRLAPRDMALLVREADRDLLLRALRHASEQASPALDFIFSGISSRVAEQFRMEMAEMEKPRRKDGEDAQTAVVAAIRALEGRGELRLLAPEEE